MNTVEHLINAIWLVRKTRGSLFDFVVGPTEHW